MALFVNTLTVDARDPLTLARFWSAALDWPIVQQDDDEVLLAPSRERSPAPGVYPLLFGRSPDAKTIKNRWHFDLAPDDQDAEVRRLEELGARRVDIGQGDQSWVVMADPEGNEFCILRSLSAEDG
jgi:predicted enzyme related to lactoylglutathione lyase